VRNLTVKLGLSILVDNYLVVEREIAFWWLTGEQMLIQ
jgi:hypothetical protein